MVLFFARKSGVLLGTACQESLDFTVVVLSLCFWCQCADSEKLRGWGLFGHLCCGLQENPKC